MNNMSSSDSSASSKFKPKDNNFIEVNNLSNNEPVQDNSKQALEKPKKTSKLSKVSIFGNEIK